jgi:glyoxylate/hydroxypyruvate reductase A
MVNTKLPATMWLRTPQESSLEFVMAERADSQRLTILIASPLEAEQAARIAAAAPDLARVIYEPDLLPVPRYPADHHGTPRALDERSLQRWREYLRAADILFDFDWLEPERMPINAPKLRWVQATSAGIGEYLIRTGLADSTIMFTTAAGVHAVPLAEHVALGLLYLTKSVPLLGEWQRAHHWERFATMQLAGRRMLLVGLGNVGRQVARTCACLGVQVWGLDPATESPPEGVSRLIPEDQFHQALGEVDALVLACPYTSKTHHLVGAAELTAMRPSAVVINIARGAVIDERELVRALQEGRLGGAVLDVFEEEPLPADSPLWDMPNVLVSPHSASTVASENERITDLFIDNLHRYLAGEPLRNVFVKSRGF